ncbi:MAG: hypothetical protein Q9175_006284 [Cornicularia normoerica]
MLDCSYSGGAFAAEELGKRRFELLTSDTQNGMSPRPGKDSFTGLLTDAMKWLLKEYPDGFCTSRLYRELFHAARTTRATSPFSLSSQPMRFDQSRHDYGKIWLRPQTMQLERRPVEERFSLNLTFTIDTRPDMVVMNELAMSLRFLPHVDRISFESLYSPTDRLVNLVRSVIYARRFRALVKKMQLQRQRESVRVSK